MQAIELNVKTVWFSNACSSLSCQQRTDPYRLLLRRACLQSKVSAQLQQQQQPQAMQYMPQQQQQHMMMMPQPQMAAAQPRGMVQPQAAAAPPLMSLQARVSSQTMGRLAGSFGTCWVKQGMD